jgi:hypothetical protein
MCDVCSERPANHLARYAGGGDDRAAVCCGCMNEEGASGCADDDCWTLEETFAYAKTGKLPHQLFCINCGKVQWECKPVCPSKDAPLGGHVYVTASD